MSRLFIVFSLFAFSLLNTIPAAAQEDLAAELYGYGVHAYNSNRHAEAFDFLERSIQHSKKDPRAFFFRGLSQHALGRTDEAKADFLHAAELEVLGSDRQYNVPVALERVQGIVRLEIEHVRRDARIRLRTVKAEQDKIKLEQFKAAENDAILDPNRPKTAAELPAELAADPDNPFADPDAKVAEITPAPAPPVVGGGAPAVAANAAEAEEPGETIDPFAAPKTTETPAADPFAPKPAAANDPFAVPEPAANPADPFAVPDEPEDTPPPAAANNAPGAAGGNRRGALGGIFRALGGLVPSAPNFAPGDMPFPLEDGDDEGPAPFNPGAPAPGDDPFNPGAPGGGADPADPFGINP